MPVTEKKYPDWVQKYRITGTTVKKRGDSYYLYKRTSRRVKGKKYPQPVDTYIGVITPEGVIQSNKRKVSLTDAVKMMTATPARILHMENRIGSLEVGKTADILLFDNQIRISRTIINGQTVYQT